MIKKVNFKTATFFYLKRETLAGRGFCETFADWTEAELIYKVGQIWTSLDTS